MFAEHKIVFAGPVGAGKTTAVQAMSDAPVVSTEARASDEVARRKQNTTVAMDYGTITLDGGAKVHLYGAPGQDRFDFMWDILTRGSIGLVLMLDNARPDPIADMEHFLESSKEFLKDKEVVIGVTRMDVKPRPGLYTYHTRLAELGYRCPVFEVDARERADIKQLLVALLTVLDPSVQR
jgi:signal recognition particle receptor subunit beta